MSDAIERLRLRREALLARSALQRVDLHMEMAPIAATLDRADRVLGTVRRYATPPVLLATGIGMALLLGRGGARRTLAGGVAMLGLFLRLRSAGQLITGLAGSQADTQAGTQPVSRSR